MALSFDPVLEREYILRITQGDATAFHAIYLHYSPRIYGKLIKVLKSNELAADILQDLFSIIWQKRKDLDPDKSFNAFLFKIADNLVIDLFRKAKRDQQLIHQLLIASVAVQDNLIEDWLFRKENETWLAKAIESLPAQRKLVFKLCKLENKSHLEVARLLNISTATVNNHLVKATQNLKALALEKTDLAGLLLITWLIS